MNRGSFIKVAVAFIGGLAAGKLPTPTEPTFTFPEGTFLLDQGTLELGIVRDSILTSVNDYQLFASGGLCAPLEPFYDMSVFAERPVRDALPTFTTSRS